MSLPKLNDAQKALLVRAAEAGREGIRLEWPDHYSSAVLERNNLVTRHYLYNECFIEVTEKGIALAKGFT